MWAARVLRGDVTSITGKSSIPGRGKKLKGRSGAQKPSKAEKAYLTAVAECMAAGDRPPPPPDGLKNPISDAGGVGRWISSLKVRKTFYVGALFAAKRRLK